MPSEIRPNQLELSKFHLKEEGWEDLTRPFDSTDPADLDRVVSIARILCADEETLLITSKLQRSDRQAFFNHGLPRRRDEVGALALLWKFASNFPQEDGEWQQIWFLRSSYLSINIDP